MNSEDATWLNYQLAQADPQYKEAVRLYCLKLLLEESPGGRQHFASPNPSYTSPQHRRT